MLTLFKKNLATVQSAFVSINMSSSKPYELRPNKLGCLVYGIDLNQPVSEECKQKIIQVISYTSCPGYALHLNPLSYFLCCKDFSYSSQRLFSFPWCQ